MSPTGGRINLKYLGQPVGTVLSNNSAASSLCAIGSMQFPAGRFPAFSVRCRVMQKQALDSNACLPGSFLSVRAGCFFCMCDENQKTTQTLTWMSLMTLMTLMTPLAGDESCWQRRSAPLQSRCAAMSCGRIDVLCGSSCSYLDPFAGRRYHTTTGQVMRP